MKRLIFCFDGTWNRLDAKYPTNVVVTAESVIPITREGITQLIYYDEGVGTDKLESFRGGVFGVGLVKNLADAYRFLIFNHTPGDEIYVFGFSRGAYTARSFVGLLHNSGILRRRDAAKVNDAIALYQSREDDTAPHAERMICFRRDHSPQICIDAIEDQWRADNITGYARGQSPILRIRYLGVWDTVGSLGVPARYRLLNFMNKKHLFHDTKLSNFVEMARHAVAIDERRKDFSPTLWDNLEVLNTTARATIDADDAPYQQKWFPGTHGSVGGGGDRRGLSDQALDWVLDGARHAGLKLDAGRASRIFELAPAHGEFLDNMSPVDKPSLMGRVMGFLPSEDRKQGPEELYQVSVSARRRWLDLPSNLRDGKLYRPPTLNGVADALNALDPGSHGVGQPLTTETNGGKFQLHEITLGETLSGLAMRYYRDAEQWPRIHVANLYKISDPQRVYVGQVLRIPIVEESPTG